MRGFKLISAKRCLDVVASFVGLLLCVPLLLLIALAVLVADGAPVLFRQARAGYKGRSFTLYKFRTMRYETCAGGQLKPDGERLTRVGRFLRSTSLDELPQLWNVIKGEMSLVGPRPLLIEYLPLYTREQARRHEVKPGLTTWNAVNGRNSMTWEQQLEMDVWYVDHQSLGLDLQIMALTVLKVLQRDGVTQEGHATRDKFRGTLARRPHDDEDAADDTEPERVTSRRSDEMHHLTRQA